MPRAACVCLLRFSLSNQERRSQKQVAANSQQPNPCDPSPVSPPHPWPFYLYSFRRAHLFNPLTSLLPPIMIIPDSDDKTSVKSSHDKSMSGPPAPASDPDQVSESPIKARIMINLPHRALPHTAPFLVKAHPPQSPRTRSLSILISLQTSPR